MKAITLFILASALYILDAHAQTPGWLWAKRIGGTSHDLGYAAVLDDSGNVYTTGYFDGTADFDPGPGIYNLAGTGIDNIFVAKYDSGGNFVWAKALNGSGTGIGGSIALDAYGNVYTAGLFDGTTDFDPGSGVFNLTAAGNYDIFICKLDASGNFIWAKVIGGIDDDEGWSMALDNSGNVYTTGFFTGTVDFDPGAATYNLTSTGQDDIFISKLDASGNFIWAKAMGGTGIDESYSIAVDDFGNAYAFGHYQSTVDFDPGAAIFNLTSSGIHSFFISKLDDSGNFVWAKTMGGSDGYIYHSIALDANRNVYTTGAFIGTADFDPGPGVFNLTSGGDWDIFISKLDNSGNFIWAKSMTGVDYQAGSSIAIDETGGNNVYTTGFFEGSADFDPGPGVHNIAATGQWGDVFISKLDSAGNFVWAQAAPGPDIGLGSAVAINSLGNLYVFGGFGDAISFGSINLVNVVPSGGTWDTFIAKLDAETILTGEAEIKNHSREISIYPNPAADRFTIYDVRGTILQVEIYDVHGKLLFSQELKANGQKQLSVDVSNLESGIYYLRMESKEKVQTEKITIIK